MDWSSLPLDVLGCIHRKLCYTDQVRLHNVCTSWRLPHEYIETPLPWVTRYSTEEDNISTLGDFGNLFDPISHQVYDIDFKRRGSAYGSCYKVTVMASKNGWLLFSCEMKTSSLIFLRNPFTFKAKMLPQLLNYYCIAATFIKNPVSPDCEFLVLCNPRDVDRFCVARFCLSRSQEWDVKDLEYGTEKELEYGHYSVLYMEGGFYCLGSKGVLKRFNLEDKSWELLTNCLSYQEDWKWRIGHIVENKGDLLMVCWLKTCSKMYEMLVFRFDKSEMSWVAQQKLENTAFFLSGKVLLSAPLMVFNGEKVEDCLLFELKESSWNSGYDYCYSLKEGKSVKSDIYSWIKRCYDSVTFIEPPYLWNL